MSNGSGGGKQQLGKILLQRKMVSPQELQTAIAKQKLTPTPVPLASQLVDDGTVPGTAALLALSQQAGVPAVDVTHAVIALANLDCLPRAAAEVLLVLPLSVDPEAVILAMADPTNKKAIDEIEFATGKVVRVRVALHTALVTAIGAAYDAKARGERCYRGPRAPAALPDAVAAKTVR
jgi:Type II secretion system (T2SS), protein E, N-terminal domain